MCFSLIITTSLQENWQSGDCKHDSSPDKAFFLQKVSFVQAATSEYVAPEFCELSDVIYERLIDYEGNPLLIYRFHSHLLQRQDRDLRGLEIHKSQAMRFMKL